MKYRDVVQFEPISTVIQLRDAGAESAARRLVETYVISERMANQIAGVVIPQLRFDVPRDNKGVLIVGNYGTGKSHLMSVLSAVAEYPDLAADLSNDTVREAAASIAGRFKVLRIEIGAVSSSLRDIVVRELEEALREWGTPYTFPPANELTNNKDALAGAVAALRERYPDHGLMLVVDELLDFLRARHEQELILDLGFLRELGEVAALAPFRFIGGLQETLFDSPRFNFVAEQLRRVRDRFEQVIIGRQDIAYVVANRILRKNDEQKARIIEHLRPYTPLYDRMAERMDEYAQLFPIHPAYVDTFQHVVVTEKREVLRTFSQAVAGLLDRDVPSDQTGLISFDHYWDVLRDNPSMKTYPEVAEVLEKGHVLDQRVSQGYTRRALTPIALRIVHALGVHRLTTGDITTPIGLTPEELRDGLCLYVPTPEASAEFLLGQVRVALREIVKTVSGQYISHNDGNDQYYLDLKKDVDFDARIDERGESLDRNDLNRYFFDSLREILDLDTSTYVSGHKIWFSELPWLEHKVTRPGYLFFGAPDERSTAQPPRDFYVYLLPPGHDRAWRDEERADEVIFTLGGLDDAFDAILRRYAGARALENESASHRTVYGDKAARQRTCLVQWVNTHLVEHLEVGYQGVWKRASAVLPRAASSASATIEDFIRVVAGTLLAPHFADHYAGYPRFTRLAQPMTEAARPGNATEAIAQIAGRPATHLGTAVLDGLQLLGENTTVDPGGSPYALALLRRLGEKSDNQVVNRGEIIEIVAGGVDRPVEKDLSHKLEPEWIAVTLVALVHHGDITLTLNGKETLDAGSVDRAATMNVETIANFQHYGRPRQLPMHTWVSIFERLGLQSALVKDETKRDQAVRELVARVQHELSRVVSLQGIMGRGLQLWNEPVFTDNFQMRAEGGAVVGIVSDGELLL
nr:ATP-binding protein [Chloroflexia bacterium]